MSDDNVVDLKLYRKLKAEIDLEEAAILSAQNMGIPDYYICGQCGETYFPAAFFAHFPCSCEDD